jgi:hypothetical protein
MQWLRKDGSAKVVIGFLLIGLGIVFFGMGIDPESDSLASFFQRFSLGKALVMTVLALLTFNWPQLLALMIGLLTWQLDNNLAGKYVVIAALILIIINTIQLFLYSPPGNG